MRAVVDTNILIRALIKPQGTVGPILTRVLKQFEAISFITPREFMQLLDEPRPAQP